MRCYSQAGRAPSNCKRLTSQAPGDNEFRYSSLRRTHRGSVNLHSASQAVIRRRPSTQRAIVAVPISRAAKTTTANMAAMAAARVKPVPCRGSPTSCPAPSTHARAPEPALAPGATPTLPTRGTPSDAVHVTGAAARRPLPRWAWPSKVTVTRCDECSARRPAPYTCPAASTPTTGAAAMKMAPSVSSSHVSTRSLDRRSGLASGHIPRSIALRRVMHGI